MPPVAVVADDLTSAASTNIRSDKVPAPAPRRKVTRRHSVDFAGSTIVEIDTPEPEAYDSIWYSKEEYDIIKARNSIIVKMVKGGKFEESDEHSFRGLEHKLKDGCKMRRENKFNALNAVLEEQDRQFARGQKDFEKISQKYEEVSYNARETAFVLAMQDAEASYAHLGLKDSEVILDDCDCSVVSDLDTVASEDTMSRKTVGRTRLFSGMRFHMKKGGTSRRASM